MMENQPMQIPDNMSGLSPSPAAMGAQTTADQFLWPTADEEPTPEEQAAYDMLVGLSLRAMSKEGVDTQLAETIRGASDLSEGLGLVAGEVFGRALGAMRKQGQQIPEDAILRAMMEVYSNVVEMAEDAGTTPDQDATNIGFSHAMDILRQRMTQMGLLTPEQARADLEEMKAMEASGELSRILSGYTGQGQGQPESQQPATGFGVALMGGR